MVDKILEGIISIKDNACREHRLKRECGNTYGSSNIHYKRFITQRNHRRKQDKNQTLRRRTYEITSAIFGERRMVKRNIP